ncbi:MAG: phosphatidate cytidylyltransferase [Campylobacteraceae bacterium]
MDTKEIKDFAGNRVITGFVLLGIALVIALLDVNFITWLALGVIAFFAFKEMLTILKIDDLTLYIYAFVIWILAYCYPNPVILVFGAAIILLSIMSYKNSVDYKKLFPIFYPLAPMLFVLSLPLNFSMSILVWLIFIVGMTDTAAYYGGRFMGVTPFSPVSPKKTREGFVAGVVVGTFVGVIFGLFLTSFWISLIVSFIVSLSSIFGDLFESYIKRQAGIKDSGNILPGHGGMLDRADGYLFGAIAMVLLLNLVALSN